MLDRQTAVWIIEGMWIIWAIIWFAKAFGNKRTIYSQSWLSRFAYVLAGVGFGFCLTYGFHSRYRLFSETTATRTTGILASAVGLGIALWARFILGSNWSGIVTLKENHELIRRGPYKYARHPIYTGVILAVVGTAIALIPLVNGLLFVFFIIVLLKIKSLQEEKILVANFPNEYPQYKKDVKSLIPFIM